MRGQAVRRLGARVPPRRPRHQRGARDVGVEAEEFFGDGDARTPAAQEILGRLADVGLGYLTIGQPLTTLSGGERIPTSIHTQELAASLGIPLTTLDQVQQIDVTIDGADEVDPQLRLIKGGGGALLREKIVASATRKLVIIADSSKQVPMLGKFPVPVEVIKFAEALVAKEIAALGAAVTTRADPPAANSSLTKAIIFLTAASARSRSARFGTQTKIPPWGGGARTLYWDGKRRLDRRRVI